MGDQTDAQDKTPGSDVSYTKKELSLLWDRMQEWLPKSPFGSKLTIRWGSTDSPLMTYVEQSLIGSECRVPEIFSCPMESIPLYVNGTDIEHMIARWRLELAK